MRRPFKIIFVLFLFFFPISEIGAQAYSGIKAGANYTFYKNSDIRKYDPRPGFQLGYVQGIRLNNRFSLAVEGIFARKTAFYKLSEETDFHWEMKQHAYYLSLPVSIHYHAGNAYFGLGYEFSRLIGGDLQVNDNDHALFVQAAYRLGAFDFALKYSHSLNSETAEGVSYTPNEKSASGINNSFSSNDINKPYPKPKANTWQMSVIYRLGHTGR